MGSTAPAEPATTDWWRHAVVYGDGLGCAVNLSGSAMPLPPDRVPLLASVDSQSDVLTPDSAAWFRSGGPSQRARVPLL
jgi:hypothetical protein